VPLSGRLVTHGPGEFTGDPDVLAAGAAFERRQPWRESYAIEHSLAGFLPSPVLQVTPERESYRGL
jgi:hypothetical protein